MQLANISTTTWITIPMLICFFGLMIGVGLGCRKHSKNVEEKFAGYDVPVVSKQEKTLG